MKRILATLFCLAFLSVTASAQETQPPKPEAKAPEAKETEALPSVDQIIDKLIESSGGKAAMEKITSRHIKGTFELPAMSASGSLEMHAKAPNKVAMIIDIPNFGVIQQAYDGKVAWENNPMAGMREITGAALAARKRDAEFYKETKLKELYKTLTVKGKQKVAEKDAYIVEAVPAEGSAEKMYFDVETGLLVRTDAEREGPEGMVSVEIYFENYKEVDGIKMPFTIRQVMPNMAILIKFDEIKHNVEIEDAKFAKPATP